MADQIVAACTQPFASLATPVKEAQLNAFNDKVFTIANTSLSDMSLLFEGTINWNALSLSSAPIGGSGGDLDGDMAKLKAVCEAIERYSSSVVLKHEYTIGSYKEVENPIDMSSIAKLSHEELAIFGQIFREFSSDEKIRWVKGVDLVSEKTVSIPLVMTHIFPRCWTSERFWNPISTGVAVHTDRLKCLNSAISEVIERDALACNWLLCRPLQRIAFSEGDMSLFPAALRPFLKDNSSIIFYDATTDVGLPTVYVRRYRPFLDKATNLVACASAFDFIDACVSALREVLSISVLFSNSDAPAVESKEMCVTIDDGARFMARKKMSHCFDFLDQQDSYVSLAKLRMKNQPFSPQFTDELERFRWLLERISSMGMNVYACELTTDEMKEIGLTSFRALIPQLMPMSTIMNARYLGSERLKKFNEYLGRQDNLEVYINENPQPFA